jgi:hypothetical protein
VPIEDGGVHVDGKATRLGGLDGRDGAVEHAFLRHRLIVLFAQPVEVHGEPQVGRRLELIELLLKKKGVGAQRDKLLARNDPFDDGADLLVDERFAARNCDHRGAAFINRLQAFLDREPAVEDLIRIVDLSAADACEIAAEQRLKHQHQRIALAAKHLLLEQVRANLHFLEERYLHTWLFPKRSKHLTGPGASRQRPRSQPARMPEAQSFDPDEPPTRSVFLARISVLCASRIRIIVIPLSEGRSWLN